jgi:hypothetical protein
MPKIPPFTKALLLSALLSTACSHVRAQQTRPIAPPPDPSAPEKLPDASVKELPDGRFQVGKVILDKKKRTLVFPAEVNMDAGPVEYFLVTTRGKTHESVLRTDAEPYHIHIGMLLLGAKAATSTDPAIFYDPKNEIPGDRISIEVTWKMGEVTRTMAAEDLVTNLQDQKPMQKGSWAYNGSQLVQGSFIAQREGSIISIISDAYALINNPRRGRENDKIWESAKNTVPAVSTVVELVFHFSK